LQSDSRALRALLLDAAAAERSREAEVKHRGGEAHMLCPDCGAGYQRPDDSCRQRFDVLLALDHSRREPWGSRHAIAFAVYALQHPSQYPEATRVSSAELLTRVFERNEPLKQVVADFRARARSRRTALSPATVPEVCGPFPVTIAALGEFEAERYATDLERWARSTLSRLAASVRWAATAQSDVSHQSGI
jgi:hypothetical protein